MTDDNRVIGRVLLVSSDQPAALQLTGLIQQLAMSVEACPEINGALRLLHERKFEAVIVDLALGELAPTLLEQVRLSTSNRTAVTFAISGGREQSDVAYKAGSSFVLERPLVSDTIQHILKAAYGSIVRERRRYFRCPIAITAVMQPKGSIQVVGQTVNISEHGMALTLPVSLEAGSEGIVQFTLPEIQNPIVAESKVCWRNDKGQAGLFFLAISAHDRSELQAWLARKLEEQLPQSVVGKFRQASSS